ncbi:hypothetical protein ASD40_15980 [Paenibacillus sp. Root444D2]|nr:hypothetical protein ASD40_15980 [Paenibacillus sp. Root444D2]
MDAWMHGWIDGRVPMHGLLMLQKVQQFSLDPPLTSSLLHNVQQFGPRRGDFARNGLEMLYKLQLPLAK